MPIYEYKCESCQAITEKIQKFSDPLLTECEKCGGKLNKLLSQSSFALKGSGWYVTDYAKKTTTNESKSEKTESPSESKDSPKDSQKDSPKESTATPCAASSPSGGCGAGACGASTNN